MSAESGRCKGRAELLAKKGASGRMQRPAELVPIPSDPLMRREGSGKLRKAPESCRILKKSRKNLVKILQNFSKILAKFAKSNFVKNQQKISKF